MMSKLRDWLAVKNEPLFFKLLEARSMLTLCSRGDLIRSYLKTEAEPKLQLGSGRNYIPGWLNTDYFAKPPRYIYLNVTRRFPLPDNAFVRVYSEHMIEHISQEAGAFMLSECFRVLKPGGRLRLETPDLEKITSLYLKKKDPEVVGYVAWHTETYGKLGHRPTICFAINDALRNWGHRFVYDEEMLLLMLKKTGFINLKRYGWNQTDDPCFQGISQRGAIKSSVFETIVMEAEKPLL